MWVLNNIEYRLNVFLPALDRNINHFNITERFDKRACKACVGNKRNIVVDSPPSYLITVGKLAAGVVLRNIHYKIEFMVRYHIHNVMFGLLVRLSDHHGFDTVIVEEFLCSCGRIYFITALHQHLAGFKKINLGFRVSGRDHNALLRNIVTNR